VYRIVPRRDLISDGTTVCKKDEAAHHDGENFCWTTGHLSRMNLPNFPLSINLISGFCSLTPAVGVDAVDVVEDDNV
jgi:hypothetical protein